jgi:carboxyl-terminal processing protease
MKKNILNKILICSIITLITILIFSIGFISSIILNDNNKSTDIANIDNNIPTQQSGTINNDFALFGEIYDVLSDYYVEPENLNEGILFNNALLSVFESLDDTHSAYIDPESFKLASSDLQGSFQGIGANIAKEGEFVIIVSPFSNSPAEKAGIKSRDKILFVDGIDARNWSTQKAAIRIRGPEGTKVIIKVEHADQTIEDITVIRGKIEVPSISFINNLTRSEQIFDKNGNEVDNIKYIRIKSFTDNTPIELKESIKKRVTNNDVGIILDLRGNPGGLLNSTLDIADMFLDGGIITIQVDRNKNEEISKASKGTITELPIVILQDKFSASGSELLAAALQANSAATIIGETSFGKGTVNTVKPLSNGGALYVSTARYLSPTRQSIERIGVIPDIESKLTMEDVNSGIDTVIIDAINYFSTINQISQ